MYFKIICSLNTHGSGPEYWSNMGNLPDFQKVL